MPNHYFQFKQFTIRQDRCAMKVTTDACLFGAWVARELQFLEKMPVRILDAGAGTGLLALMLAQETEASIDAVELEVFAAEQATENVAASPWAQQVSIIHQNLFKWQPEQPYDCIVSNPPFYENELKSDKPSKNTAHHDAGLTLAALLSFIKTNLSPGGIFFLLLPAKREADFLALATQHTLALHKVVRVIPVDDKAPFRLMIKGGRQGPELPSESEITIRENRGQYTPAFVSLLKRYYLHL